MLGTRSTHYADYLTAYSVPNCKDRSRMHMPGDRMHCELREPQAGCSDHAPYETLILQQQLQPQPLTTSHKPPWLRHASQACPAHAVQQHSTEARAIATEHASSCWQLLLALKRHRNHYLMLSTVGMPAPRP